MKTNIILGMLILLIPLAYAAPPGNATAPGGNVTQMNITATKITPNWQGYAGTMTYGTGATAPTTVNATGSNVSGQGFHLQIPCNSPTAITGFILFSNSSANPIGLVPGNLTQLDAFVPGNENGTRTFTATSTFNFPSAGIIAGVPTTHTYVGSTPQNATFREGYFNDAAGNIVFATEINFIPAPGYNLSSFSYQIMVAAPNYSTVPYYIFSDLTATCPGGGRGGGGASRSWFCVAEWNCSAWGPCTNKMQTRTCTQTNKCVPRVAQFPPIEQYCEEQECAEPEATECVIEDGSSIIKEDEISYEEIFKNIDFTIPGKIDALALNQIQFDIEIHNKNDLSIEDVSFRFDIPAIKSIFKPIHQHKTIFWSHPEITGLGLRPGRQGNYQGEINLPEPGRISPRARHTKTIEITPPAMMPQEVNAALTVLSGEREIMTRNMLMKTEVNEFDAGYSFNPETRVLALFFIADNRGKPAREKAFIELNLNKGRSTKIAELFGPYDFPANEVTILSQEYKLSKKISGEYEMKAALYDDKEINEVRKECIISG